MIKENMEHAERQTLTDHIRKFFKKPVELVGSTLYRWGISPNTITLIGFIGTCVGAVFVSLGKLVLGGAMIMLMTALDGIDGAVARASGENKPFGAFIDSVFDRYGEIAIYTGLVWYFTTIDQRLGVILSILALSGSVLVSYARARAQSLGMETKIGILTRVERAVVIGPAIFFRIPFWGVAVVAVLANITALQRINHVRQQSIQIEVKD